jgi:signal transduction histidine kinase
VGRLGGDMQRRGAKWGARKPRRTDKPATRRPPRANPSIADLQEQLDMRTRERDEALEQQAATAEVLKVISSSTGKLEPVFQTILENSITICEAKFGMFWLTEGHSFRCVALHGTSPAFTELRRREPIFHPNPTLLTPLGRIARTKQLVQVTDCRAEQAYIQGDPGFVALVDLAGARTILVVPILRDDELVGVFNIFRQEVRPFTDKQIELVTNFASQAVIAIENTRLLNELRERTDDLSESLEQQTATSEVLKIVSSSAGKLEPVFDAMLANATRICEAAYGAMWLREHDKLRNVAFHGDLPAAFYKLWKAGSEISLDSNVPIARAVRSGKAVVTPDLKDDPGYREGHPLQVGAVDLGGIRTLIAVPMVKEGELVGGITIYRREVRLFTDKQVELVQNFAAQAVIAIENTRLLNDLRQRTHELATSLDNLRAAQDRLVQTEKLASLGQLTAGIAHEIKNPLNFVNNFSGISAELIGELQNTLSGLSVNPEMQAEIDDLIDTLRGNLEKVVQHGKRADGIVKSMLMHSGESSGQQQPTDINALVEESLNRAYYNARAEQRGFTINLEKSFDPTAGEAHLFPREITRALLNLISNGFYAATKRNAEAKGDGHEPILSAATKSLGDRVEIRIRDNGTGMTVDVKEQMFNPFFTTKPTGEGTGLGLSISHDIIVKQHGGSIEVDTQPGQFTEIRVILPRTPALLPDHS